MRVLIFLILVAAVVAVGTQIVFTVDETQLAIVTRFGEPVRDPIQNPGLNFKTPFVESVIYLDKRLLLFDAPPSSLLTKDKKNLVIDVYARGRIVDPLLFVQTVATEREGANRAIEIVASALREEIALDNQSEIIRTSREDVMNRIRDAVSPRLMPFGIETVDVRLKRADFPAEIAASVFERMKAERKRIADRERAEGAKTDAEVRSDVDRQAKIIESAAQRDADIIRGCGEAEAIRIFAESLEQDPEFYTFQRSLELYKTYLTQNTTIVGSSADLGGMFESIRQAAFEAAEVPEGKLSSTAPTIEGSESVCARFEIESAARKALATKLDVDRSAIDVTSVEPASWGDVSLGCPIPGESYAQVVTSGFRLALAHESKLYVFHTNEDGSLVVDCTPIDTVDDVAGEASTIGPFPPIASPRPA